MFSLKKKCRHVLFVFAFPLVGLRHLMPALCDKLAVRSVHIDGDWQCMSTYHYTQRGIDECDMPCSVTSSLATNPRLVACQIMLACPSVVNKPHVEFPSLIDGPDKQTMLVSVDCLPSYSIFWQDVNTFPSVLMFGILDLTQFCLSPWELTSGSLLPQIHSLYCMLCRVT